MINSIRMSREGGFNRWVDKNQYLTLKAKLEDEIRKSYPEGKEHSDKNLKSESFFW